jgi:branched-chain amino acid transport system substrate-binding protein
MRSFRRAVVAALVVAVSTVTVGLHAQEDGGEGKDDSYGRTPEKLTPFRGVGEPARRFFVEAPAFRGPGREDAPPPGLTSVRFGVLAPVHGPDAGAGRHMLQGVRLALEEANAKGGFGPQKLPFEMVVRNEAESWGAAGDAAVDLVYDDGAWALIGGYEDANSHVLTRVLLKLEVPNVNTAGVDPTLTEHNIPWLVRVRPDDRQASYRLARRVFEEDARKRVVLFRANSRYGRTGTGEFKDAARRLHHPVLLETRYEASEADWKSRVERIRALRPDAVVLWGRPAATGAALRALRAGGVDCAAYGPDRAVGPGFLEAAGDAAEGFVFTYPLNPDARSDAWPAFVQRYRERFGTAPDPTASFAYDGARLLVEATRKAGLNRARIRDALYEVRRFEGVSGRIRFDTTQNNVSPVILGHVENGRLHFDG